MSCTETTAAPGTLVSELGNGDRITLYRLPAIDSIELHYEQRMRDGYMQLDMATV